MDVMAERGAQSPADAQGSRPASVKAAVGEEGGQTSAPEVDRSGQTVLTPVATAVAVGLIVVFVLSLWFMAAKRGDQNWERLTFLFQGFEALVFAGAGALFGTTIQRQQATASKQEADKARVDADTQRARADTASDRAKEGEMIAVLAKSKRDRARAGARSGRSGEVHGARPDEGTPDRVSNADLEELGALADKYFPSI